MRTGSLVTLLAVVAALAVVPVAGGADPKYPATPQQIREYRDSGDWGRDKSAVARRAKAWLRKRTQSRRAPRRPALVLDIDDTSLDNYPCINAGDFQDVDALRTTCLLRYDAPAIRPTRSLYRLAHTLKVSVFFITGRPDAFRRGTRANLRSAGYRGRYRLVTRPAGYDNPSAVPYKSAARRAIERRGFTILANVGDQRSDLRGGYSERRFYVPNPMYFIE